MFNPEIIKFLLKAKSKALATTGPHGLNVVPVSTIKIKDDKIILVDYFFNKTRENLKSTEAISLTAWTGLSGYQIKAKSLYQSSGKLFEEVIDWISEIHPERKVIGVIELTPIEIHDISIDELV